MMDDTNPARLRERAETYDQIALRINDDQALRALRDMARDYRLRADDLSDREVTASLQLMRNSR